MTTIKKTTKNAPGRTKKPLVPSYLSGTKNLKIKQKKSLTNKEYISLRNWAENEISEYVKFIITLDIEHEKTKKTTIK